MTSRANLRRKMVLSVTVIRHEGQEKQLAHTLDVTETSARLGGLAAMLEPGEIIDVQRGGIKAKFQVVWMGASGGAMAGQAGIRGVDPQKCIWNISMPDDETDTSVDTANLRRPVPPAQDAAQFPGERRWHARYACNGSAALKTPGTAFAMHGEVKDVSIGGVYIELSAPLPVDSQVNLDLCVEDIRFEAAGVVRTSYPLLGMGVCLQDLTPESTQRLALAVEKAKRKVAPEPAISSPSPESISPGSGAEENPASLLIQAGHRLASDFERWKLMLSPDEIQELKLVIHDLEQMLSPVASVGIIEYLGAAIESSKPI